MSTTPMDLISTYEAKLGTFTHTKRVNDAPHILTWLFQRSTTSEAPKYLWTRARANTKDTIAGLNLGYLVWDNPKKQEVRFKALSKSADEVCRAVHNMFFSKQNYDIQYDTWTEQYCVSFFTEPGSCKPNIDSLRSRIEEVVTAKFVQISRTPYTRGDSSIGEQFSVHFTLAPPEELKLLTEKLQDAAEQPLSKDSHLHPYLKGSYADNFPPLGSETKSH
ncbi:MAG: hypothetical protein S4CHLAM81_01290 [Chlamydiales bacterium]|nr:hypothetical protein [Chlamydiales bacterium]MCH9634925.1 hypothetical protein [Chlamydiales bacterium]